MKVAFRPESGGQFESIPFHGSELGSRVEDAERCDREAGDQGAF